MGTHIPNPETYRAWLGEEVNRALFELVQHKNSTALTPIGVNEYLRKMIAHWYENEFDRKFPVQLKSYHEDLDIVQSA